jgi:mono/diheme cytochrome c family protein
MRGLPAILALTVLAGACAAGAGPQPGGRGAGRQDVAAGERFVRRACAGCHAVGPQGASPNPHSPPFRTLAARLPGEALPAQLAAIARRGHVEMPPIYMTPEELEAAAAYIRSIAEQARPAAAIDATPGPSSGNQRLRSDPEVSHGTRHPI